LVIPNYIEVKKFRVKKLTKSTESVGVIGVDLTNVIKLINNKYKAIVQ
jgi:DNA-binding Xre family transcriptional regulator